jgi:hypothetical protein
MRVIPTFQPDGLLPKGIHWALLDEITKRFGTNSHRRHLLRGFERAAEALSSAGCRALYLDGSFVTEKPLPKDYDACWEMAGVRRADLDPVFLEHRNGRAAQKLKYLGEFFPAHAVASVSVPLSIYLNFFQIDKATGDPKGIVGLKLQEKP